MEGGKEKEEDEGGDERDDIDVRVDGEADT